MAAQTYVMVAPGHVVQTARKTHRPGERLRVSPAEAERLVKLGAAAPAPEPPPTDEPKRGQRKKEA